MRILHIIDTFWLGGAQTILKSIFEHQQENDNIFVFSLRKTSPQITINHKNVECLNSRNKLSFRRFSVLKKYIKENKIEVLHCHLPHAQAMGYFMKKFYFKKIKMIFHEHAEIYKNSIILNTVLKKSRKKVDKYITCSKHSKLMLHNNIKIEPVKITVINNFVDTDVFNPELTKLLGDTEREKYNINPNDFVVGFAGRLVRRKGWREMLYAAEELKDNTNIKFLVAGTGTDEKKFLSLINKLGLSEKVIFLEYYKNMPLFYSITDCLIIPSYWEGMPLVQLEAMAMQIPVICSDAPGLNEIFERDIDILYTDIHDFMAIKKNIELLYSDKNKYAELVKNALIKINYLNINTYIVELNDIYK